MIFLYLVFDIGGTFIKYGLVNSEGVITSKGKLSSSLVNSQEDVVNAFTKIYKEQKALEDIKGIAVSTPGGVDVNKGIIYNGGSLGFLHNMPITQMLWEACDHIPVAVENDGKCAGLAEVWLGNAKDVKDAIVITYGTGIGGAIIKDKKIHRGNRLIAGELSCLMNNYSPDEIPKSWADYNSALKLGRDAEKIKNLPKGSINGEKFFEMINEGDEECMTILKNFCYISAIQIYNLQYIFDPDIFCIGGGISEQEIFIKEIENQIQNIYGKTKQVVIPKIRPCMFHNNSNLLGALFNFFEIYGNA